MTLTDWFEKGISPEAYLKGMQTHKENTAKIYEGFHVPSDDHAFFQALCAEKLRVIVLTEDWCGDAMMNLPILLKIAEKSEMEVRILLRDQNLELMDQYLTNGTSRSIPIFIFLDQDGEEKAVWGPRAKEVQSFVEQTMSSLPAKDDPSFDEKRKEMIAAMTKKYVNDTQMWTTVYESVKKTLSNMNQ
ncbi:thioredoxin family protein [Bacillus chungangensis]|uniref:Thioredoxin family protein n=1 Tax=Bacillus chungangensis TaxID=587633 RepID=A0ABT9WS72_9BACI|nr:thioredoxin family protein [Bacillus chungangensis]MDQ0176060.1 hypothetical protein [Bacillus chungangensis]